MAKRASDIAEGRVLPPEPVFVKTGEKYFKMHQMSQKDYFSKHNNLGTIGKMKTRI